MNNHPYVWEKVAGNSSKYNGNNGKTGLISLSNSLQGEIWSSIQTCALGIWSLNLLKKVTLDNRRCSETLWTDQHLVKKPSCLTGPLHSFDLDNLGLTACDMIQRPVFRPIIPAIALSAAPVNPHVIPTTYLPSYRISSSSDEAKNKIDSLRFGNLIGKLEARE